MLMLQQGVDHGVLKMGTAPPCDKCVGVAGPALCPQEPGGEVAQSTLHVHDGTVLVEHAYFDGRFQVAGVCHPRGPFHGRAFLQTYSYHAASTGRWFAILLERWVPVIFFQAA